jgi:hypothetical protein
MNLNDLTEVIRHIRREMVCPSCQKKYNIQNIHILASSKTECLIEMYCKYCKKTMLTDIVATPKGPNGKIAPEDRPKQEVPLINQVLTNGISHNDVLDVHNFLENFDGDFKELFKN